MPLASAQASSDVEKPMASNGAPLRYAVDAMSDTPDGPPPRAGERRRLDSWKEIAAYLGRGIRTVQRWEREEGLPVHRLAHADRGSVFADPTELTEWWKSRQIAPTAKPSPAVDAPPKPRLQRVTTTTAATFWPSLSSDGRMVVYVSDAGQDGATPQVWLQQVGGAAVQLTTGMRECAEPAFSHDDTRVIFSAAADSTRHVYEVPTLGGQPRVLKRMARGARFAPDGKWLVYLAIDSHDAVRIVSATGDERVVATGLVDVAFATWSDDSRHLLVVGHPDPSADHDCWIVPVDGGAPVDTGVLRRARQQGSIVISMAVAWTGDSIFFTAAGRQGVHVWRQRVSPTTFEAIGSPELMTPGADSAFFPTVARQRLGFVGVHTDTNMWSVGIDPKTGIAQGQPRRLTRGGGFVSHFSVSRDGNTLAYFAAGSSGVELRVRDMHARHRRRARGRSRRQSRFSGDLARRETARVRNAGRRTARQTSGVRGESRGWSVPVDFRRLRRPSAALARRRAAAGRDLRCGAEFVCRARHARRPRSARCCLPASAVCRTLAFLPMHSGWRSTPRRRADLPRCSWRGSTTVTRQTKPRGYVLRLRRVTRSGRETDACCTTCRRRRPLIFETG